MVKSNPKNDNVIFEQPLTALVPCKNVLKGSVGHWSCLESLILSINPSILPYNPSIPKKNPSLFVAALVPCKNVLKGSVGHWSCLESLILSINPSILTYNPSIPKKESFTLCCCSSALKKRFEGVCGPLVLFRIPNSVY